MPQKVVKGYVVTDFFTEQPVSKFTKLYEDLLDEVAEVCMTQTSFIEQV